jgi:nucleoside-diphosphate-sugar epimerase
MLSFLFAVVLVTGASGFIASHIIKQLQEQGYKVRGTVRSLQDEDKVKRLNELCPEAENKLDIVEADLTKPESWEA